MITIRGEKQHGQELYTVLTDIPVVQYYKYKEIIRKKEKEIRRLDLGLGVTITLLCVYVILIMNGIM